MTIPRSEPSRTCTRSLYLRIGCGPQQQGGYPLVEPPPEKTLLPRTAASFRKEEPAGFRAELRRLGSALVLPTLHPRGPGSRSGPHALFFSMRIWYVVSEAPESPS